MILYALLAGNDLNAGVQGLGPETALAIAQCGFGNTLIEEMAGLPTQRQQYLWDLKHEIFTELKYNSKGSLQRRYPAIAQTLLDSNFPSRDALNWFLNPPNSWSDPSLIPNSSIWRPQGHNIPRIAQFCRNHIGWPTMKALKKFRKQLWRGVIIRMLCSVRLLTWCHISV